MTRLPTDNTSTCFYCQAFNVTKVRLRTWTSRLSQFWAHLWLNILSLFLSPPHPPDWEVPLPADRDLQGQLGYDGKE
jgi:hypothetical protein